MSQEGRNPPRPTQDGSKIGRRNAQADRKRGIWGAFQLAAHVALSRLRATRSLGPVETGGLYAYYKRLFPRS
jgi:hypothetical protein